MTEPVDLIEACRAQIAACRELAFARQFLGMASDPDDQAHARSRYYRALAAARAATRVSDAAQSAAWDEMNATTHQPELFP